MPAPSRQDALTVLVFLGAGTLGLVVAAFGLWIIELLVGDFNAVIEAITATAVIVGGGGFAAAKYRQMGKG